MPGPETYGNCSPWRIVSPTARAAPLPPALERLSTDSSQWGRGDPQPFSHLRVQSTSPTTPNNPCSRPSSAQAATPQKPPASWAFPAQRYTTAFRRSASPTTSWNGSGDNTAGVGERGKGKIDGAGPSSSTRRSLVGTPKPKRCLCLLELSETAPLFVR